jgi:outer membrane protein assembly factor BamD
MFTMTGSLHSRSALRRLGAAGLLLVALSACGPRSRFQVPAAGEAGAEKFLFDRGQEALERRRWIDAREYFRRLIDTYPGSEFRRSAKIGLGDSYLGEGHPDSLILAASEFREFLTFFPLAPDADYAQYRLATCHMRQMLGPQRDQTATVTALREIDAFIQSYPKSKYMAEVLAMRRQARDRLSEHEYQVGLSNFRIRVYAGAIARFEGLLAADPQFTRRDAVYYYLAESFVRLGRRAEALQWFERLQTEFTESSYLDEARTRVAELKR